MVELPPHRRLFIAFDLPVDTRSLLREMGERAAAAGDGAAVPAANLHVTVTFLGHVDQRVTDRLVPDLFDACHGRSHRAVLGAAVARPRAGRARLMAVEVDDPDGTIAAQVGRIVDVVRPLMDDHDAERPFWPHVTVARFRRPTRVRGFPAPQHEHVFAINRVTLYDSVTSSKGPPVYRPLMTVPLGASCERNTPDG